MYQLKITVIAKDGTKPLLERIIELQEFCSFDNVTLKAKDSPLLLCDVRFDSILESMNILYSKVPHIVTFSFEKL